jgi:hypothetical protein
VKRDRGAVSPELPRPAGNTGKLGEMGGSVSDDFNYVLIQQVCNSLWVAHSDPAARREQRRGAGWHEAGRRTAIGGSCPVSYRRFARLCVPCEPQAYRRRTAVASRVGTTCVPCVPVSIRHRTRYAIPRQGISDDDE